MIHTRDMPVAGWFTENVYTKDFYFDLGTGLSKFSLDVNVQTDAARAKATVFYGSTKITELDNIKGLGVLSGEVTTTGGYLKVTIETSLDTTVPLLLWVVILELTCDKDSNAPTPYRVKVNTTGTGLIDDTYNINPSGVTDLPTTKFRDTTTTIFGYTTTAFDPSPVNPTTLSPTTVIPTGPPTGRPDDPPFTTLPPPGPTQPPTTLPVTSAPPITYPATPEPTVAPTPPPTVSPTLQPLTLIVKTNDDGFTPTVIEGTTYGFTGRYIINNKEHKMLKPDNSEYASDSIILSEASGGSGSYRFRYENLKPNQFPLRVGALPSVDADSAGVVTGLVNVYQDKELYHADAKSNLVLHDKRVHIYGVNDVSIQQSIKVTVDDGYSSISQIVLLPAKKPVLETSIDKIVIELTRAGIVDILTPLSFLQTNRLVFKYEPTNEDSSEFHIVEAPGSRTCDFHTDKIAAYFKEETAAVRYNYTIKDGKSFTEIKIPTVYNIINRFTHMYWWWGNSGGYQNYSPIPLGVLRIYLKDIVSGAEVLKESILLWRTNGGHYGLAGASIHGRHPSYGFNTDFTYTGIW